MTNDDRAAHREDARTLDPSRILTSIGEVPYHWDIATDALTWGANACSVLGVKDRASIATGRLYARLLDSGNTEQRFDAVMRSDDIDRGDGVSYSVQYCLRVGGEPEDRHWVEDSGRWFAGPDGRPARAHGVVRVINERRAHQDRLAYLSRFDGLTGEMNRWHLTEVLAQTLGTAIRDRLTCGFLLVSIDNIDRVNDAYGFETADEVIAAVAKRLRLRMRAGDSLGRFSGSKFGVILNHCSPGDMAVAAERLIAGVREDVMQTTAGAVSVTVTVGGVVAPRHARSVQEMIARAEESIFNARAKRLGSFRAYHPNVERDVLRQENVRATDEIVAALNERQLLLAFEPVVETSTRKTDFFECLVRIRRTDGSWIPASRVIPVAERLGLIRLIDRRVLDLVVAELVAAPGLRLSLNVSPASTIDPEWWASLDAQLRRHSGIGERLIVEITEMAAIHDLDDTRGFVRRVKDRGCRIAIDDFGAGNTSFRNLRKLGVDMVKIDGDFIQNLSRSADDRVFVRALIELAKGLQLATVAEWVKDEEAAFLLADWGCDYLQGELIGPAVHERPDVGAIAPAIRAASA